MNDKDLKLLRYIAGAILILKALSNILLNYGLDSIYDYASTIFSICSILIAIGIFFVNTKCLIIGCGIGALSSVICAIGNIIGVDGIYFIIGNASSLVCYTLIAILLLSQKNYKRLLLIAITAVFFVEAVLTNILGGYYAFSTLLVYRVFVGVKDSFLHYFPIFVGIMTLNKENTPIVPQRIKSNPAQNMGENSIERVTRLKELMDCGAISREEFDEKKKQLLGL